MYTYYWDQEPDNNWWFVTSYERYQSFQMIWPSDLVFDPSLMKIKSKLWYLDC